MKHFNEKHLHAIDPKGRLQLGRDVRRALKLKKGEALYLLPAAGGQPHLEIRTSAQWKDYQERFLGQAPGGRKRDFMRFVELSMETVTADAQGRFSIPRRLRELCQLDGQVAVINMTFCVEVWNTEFVGAKWNEFARAFEDFNDSLL
ncbi:MAG: hypothetical protein OEO21_10045 [Candidatus Krumholzibacteria bacterium]|nr:hypothetical protein [Candidatus Krumholzibacteria bacterium]